MVNVYIEMDELVFKNFLDSENRRLRFIIGNSLVECHYRSVPIENGYPTNGYPANPSQICIYIAEACSTNLGNKPILYIHNWHKDRQI